MDQRIHNRYEGIAANDTGIGMLAVLGYEFLDKDKNKLTSDGGNLINIKKI